MSHGSTALDQSIIGLRLAKLLRAAFENVIFARRKLRIILVYLHFIDILHLF